MSLHFGYASACCTTPRCLHSFVPKKHSYILLWIHLQLFFSYLCPYVDNFFHNVRSFIISLFSLIPSFWPSLILSFVFSPVPFVRCFAFFVCFFFNLINCTTPVMYPVITCVVFLHCNQTFSCPPPLSLWPKAGRTNIYLMYCSSHSCFSACLKTYQ